jgi:putative flippase GtrA
MMLRKWIFGGSLLTPAEQKIRELVMYFIFGGLTTLINLICFICFDKIFGSQEVILALFGFKLDILDIINTTIAWIIAVSFAFVTNRAFVFHSKGPVIREFFGFVSSRIFTLVVFEIGFLELGVLFVEHVLNQNKDTVFLTIGSFSTTYLYVIKIAIAFFVIAGNYLLSKLFVFRVKKDQKKHLEGSVPLVDDKET